MKRIFFGLGCTLVSVPGLLAQDGAPSARLRLPTVSDADPAIIRAQAPDISPAAIFPKVMPKGATSESSSGPPMSATPGTLPVPGPAIPSATGPAAPLPPGAPIPQGQVIVDPPGTPIPPGATVIGGPPLPGVIGSAGDPSRWYVAAEAMTVWIKRYEVPPLVTVGPAFSGANLAVRGVTSLFGGETVADNPRYGGKFTLGYWLTPCWAIEASAFYVRPSSHQFNALSAEYASQDLARPFFSANTGMESSEIVGRPGVASGYVSIDQKSSFYGAELNARNKWWQSQSNSLDLIGGFRYLSLEERLTISEQSTGLAGAGSFAGVSRAASDDFLTHNHFYGLQAGGIFTHVEGRWTFDLTGKLAIGVTRQYVDINGSVTPLSGGPVSGLPGGLLALNSNIGPHNHQQFSVVPEIGLKASYDLTSHLKVFAGYNFLYWTGVVRPGGQIDRVLDENRIPGFPAAAAASGTHPVATSPHENLWAQGVNFGLLYKW
jgi:Putative beta barrel porin-7 (BBP7)